MRITRILVALGVSWSMMVAAVPAGGATGWIPANAGVMWWQPNDPLYPLSLPRQPPGEGSGAWWLTRRIGTSPLVPGAMHMGSFFHGLYASEGGGGWVSVTPGCLLPLEPPGGLARDTYRAARRAAIALTGLDACGVEGLAYDPIIPTRIYASAYDVVALNGVSATLGDGGVYVSDNLGVTWTKLRGGMRGNGLAVHRSSAAGRATIVAGFIQSGGSVGATPSNGSLTLSRDDGRTWKDIVLPSSGCGDVPLTSQRITPSVAIDPTNPARIYAGTNAGLYDSSDGGATWTLRKPACGGVWGLALTPDGRTIYVGDKDGVVSRAPTSTMSFTPIADLGAGKVQSLVLDPLDVLGAALYAAMWDGSGASVYRVDAITGGVGKLDGSLLGDVDDAWPSTVPRPFPLTFSGPDGSAPSLFLGRSLLVPSALWVSTVLRGAFVRQD